MRGRRLRRDTADWLAGALLVREAGDLVTDLRGDPFGWHGEGVRAGSAATHAGLLDLTREALTREAFDAASER